MNVCAVFHSLDKCVLIVHQVSYMISAWARMCKIIGSGFVQYLPMVMGPLIQAASLKPEIAFVDGKVVSIWISNVSLTGEYKQEFTIHR